jgi:hypothetical protein
MGASSLGKAVVVFGRRRSLMGWTGGRFALRFRFNSPAAIGPSPSIAMSLDVNKFYSLLRSVEKCAPKLL